jgi:hypothetical protein
MKRTLLQVRPAQAAAIGRPASAQTSPRRSLVICSRTHFRTSTGSFVISTGEISGSVCYRDTFRFLFSFPQQASGKRPNQLIISNLTAAQLIAFLQYQEEERGNCVKTRNLRVAALRSLFRYVGACEGPETIAQIQRIMAIPLKRFARPLLGFLSQSKMEALCKPPTIPGVGGAISCSSSFSTTPELVCPKLSPSGCKTYSDTIIVPYS